MATIFGKHLKALADNNIITEAISLYGPLAYAVVIKIDEYSQLSDHGEISTSTETYKLISSELNASFTKVSDVIDFLIKKGWLKQTVISLYNVRIKEVVTHHNNISEIRKKAQSKAKNPGRKPIDHTMDEETKLLYDKYLAMINEVFGKSYRGDKTSKRQFNARIKEGYELKDFKIAALNAKGDEYHEKRGYVHCTPEFFSRDLMLNKWMHGKSQQSPQFSLSTRLSQS